MPSADRVATFSADDIPEDHRDEFIRDFYGRIQMRLDITPHADTPLAFEVGFNEPSTFYRQFRLRYGMTPTEVRALTEKAGNG